MVLSCFSSDEERESAPPLLLREAEFCLLFTELLMELLELDSILFESREECVFCFCVGEENKNMRGESIKYPCLGGKGVTASVTKCE